MSQSLSGLYARLPVMHCKGKCADSCGPIGMSKAEYDALRSLVGERIQAITLDTGEILLTNYDKELHCPLLANGKCSVYENRPMICRLWGMVKKMRCPHGCRPRRWISREESFDLLDAARRLK